VRDGERMRARGVAARAARDRAGTAAALAVLLLAGCSASHRQSESSVGVGAGGAGSGSAAGGSAGSGAAGVSSAGRPSDPPPPMDCRSRLLASGCIGQTLRICRPDGSFEDRACSRDASCRDGGGRAACVCSAGFEGDGFTCKDFDECAAGTALCSDRSTCVNLLYGYSCGSCPSGYDDVRGDGGFCRDIDECAFDNGGCDPLASCTNYDGGYDCGSCPAGHVGHGTSCTPGLLDLSVWPGQLSPAFATQTTWYSVNVPVLTETLAVYAAPTDGANTTIAGEQIAWGAGWTSPLLTPGGLDSFAIHVRSAAAASTQYELTVQRASLPTYLKSPASAGADSFGHRVAVSENVLAASAPGAANGGTLSLFERLPDESWYAADVITGEQVAPGDGFGHGIAAGWNVIVAGAPFDDGSAAVDSGAVYVFERQHEFAAWMQTARLKATNPAAGDQFGYSVALFGDTLVVGAPFDDGATDALSDSGAAFVFVRDPSGVWAERARVTASNAGSDDLFGADVALHQGTLVIAAPREDSGSPGVNGTQADESAPGSGAAYVFVGEGDTWTQEAYLKASNPGGAASASEHGDYFGGGLSFGGRGVAVFGDTIAVGATTEDSSAAGIGGTQNDEGLRDSGAVYVFARVGASWTQQAYVKASHPGAGDGFGNSIALWEQQLIAGAYRESGGGTSIFGDPADDTLDAAGAVYVFERGDGAWFQRLYLKASNPEAEDGFGCSVAAGEGTFAIGAAGEDSLATGVDGDPGNHAGGESAGAVYVFR